MKQPRPKSRTSALGKSAIVFSCDDAYMPLARGLVLSLAAAAPPDGDFRSIFIDIGCSEEALCWMAAQRVEIVKFDARLIPSQIMTVIRPHQRAQVIRPWLPELLPEIEHFIWLDSDVWLQNSRLLSHLRDGSQMAPESVMLAPGMSLYNSNFYLDIGRVVTMQKTWFEACYPAEFVNRAAMMLHYSSGVFGLRRSSPVWESWRNECLYLYPAVAQRDPRL